METQKKQIDRVSRIRLILDRNDIPVLPDEKKALEAKLAHLANKQRELGRELGLSMKESAETWHDNAPAEAIATDAHRLSSEAESLIELLSKVSVIEIPSSNFENVTVGSKVQLKFTDLNKTKIILLTGSGYLPDRVFDEKNHPLEVISVSSPLGKAILEHSTGDIIEFTVNNRVIKVEIIQIDQSTFED